MAVPGDNSAAVAIAEPRWHALDGVAGAERARFELAPAPSRAHTGLGRMEIQLRRAEDAHPGRGPRDDPAALATASEALGATYLRGGAHRCRFMRMDTCLVGPPASICRPRASNALARARGVVEGLRQEQHPLGVPELALQASQAGVRPREGQRQLEPGPFRSCHPLECLPARLGDGHSRGVVPIGGQAERGVAQGRRGTPASDRVLDQLEECQSGLRVGARLGTVPCVLRDLGCEQVQPCAVVVAFRDSKAISRRRWASPGAPTRRARAAARSR